MAQSYCNSPSTEPYYLNGAYYITCPDCGGHPRQVSLCKRCNYSGAIGITAPDRTSYSSNGATGSSNNTGYGGSTGVSNGGNWQGSAQQGYGKAARR